MAKKLVGSVGLTSSGVPDDLLTTKGDTHGYSSTNARIPIGDDDDVLTADSGEALGLKWSPPSASGTLVKVTKSYTDVSSLELPIYTLPATQALVNVFADITTTWDVGSTAVTIGDASDENGFQEATDWSSTGLTSATRGVYVSGFKGMRSTSSTTAIVGYGFVSGGSTFTQASTNDQEQLNTVVTGRTQIGQLYQAGQILVGEDVSKASFFLKCATADATGTLTAFIRREDGTLVASSTTNLDATTITASYVEYTFDFPSTTIVANDMIMISSASLGTSNVDVATNSGANITNGIYMEEYNEVYRDAGKTASIKMTVTYGVTSLTQGAVDFYLQIAKE